MKIRENGFWECHETYFFISSQTEYPENDCCLKGGSSDQTIDPSTFLSAGSGIAPCNRCTSLPPLNNIIVGIAVILYCMESSGFVSVLTLITLTLPLPGQFLKNRSHHFARPAPLSPEINKNRQIACGDIFLKAHITVFHTY